MIPLFQRLSMLYNPLRKSTIPRIQNTRSFHITASLEQNMVFRATFPHLVTENNLSVLNLGNMVDAYEFRIQNHEVWPWRRRKCALS